AWWCVRPSSGPRSSWLRCTPGSWARSSTGSTPSPTDTRSATTTATTATTGRMLDGRDPDHPVARRAHRGGLHRRTRLVAAPIRVRPTLGPGDHREPGGRALRPVGRADVVRAGADRPSEPTPVARPGHGNTPGYPDGSTGRVRQPLRDRPKRPPLPDLC